MPDTVVPALAPSRHVPDFVQLLEPEMHREALAVGLEVAAAFDRIEPAGAPPRREAVDGIFSLAEWQSPFRNQANRGTCWAFAGTAALEAAYRRQLGLQVDIAEEYVFHMGKAFALNRDATGAVFAPVENNSSLTGAQGSGDIVKKISENAVASERTAPYLPTQAALEALLPVLGFADTAALATQEDFDAVEFCEQHIPLAARADARYRASGWASLGGHPSVEALENTLLAEHEVVCDVTQVGTGAGHVILLVGFDRNRRVFIAKNSWGENAFIEVAYEDDPAWRISSGWYITGVVDPTETSTEACWLGNWRVESEGASFHMILRRTEDFAAPGTPTRLGSAYLADGRHDVNGSFADDGAGVRLFVAPGTAAVPPGTLAGTELLADLDSRDIHTAAGTLGGKPAVLTRFNTRFAALFEPAGAAPWQARHGLDGAAYQATFDDLVPRGFRLKTVSGYSEGLGARFNAVWAQEDGPAWQARHGLDGAAYQATFDDLVRQGFRLSTVSGYAERGEARYAALFERSTGTAWQARHGLSPAEYEAALAQMAVDGFVPVQVSGYRVNRDVRFAALWEQRPGVSAVARQGLTASQYQAAFDAQVAQGFRLVDVSGYSDGGIARYAAVWHRDAGQAPWQARHGLDGAGYQQAFDALAAQGFRPVRVVGYGDGFAPA